MSSAGKGDITDELTEFVRDLFTESKYEEWRNVLYEQRRDRWYSLIVGLDRHDAPLDRIRSFGEQVYSKTVFQCIEAPDFKSSNELVIVFKVSGWIWSSVVNFSTPNDDL